MSRAEKSALNSIVGLCCCFLSSLLTFFLRGAFIRLLGLEYAGINSLFTDILKLLNLADLGVSNAILVRLYRSCAQKDDEETELYLSTYRRICYFLAVIITLGGLACTPFLKYLIKSQPAFPEPLWSLFVLVLGNNFINHAWCYTPTLFTAKQERYIATLIQYGCLFLRHGAELLLLLRFRNIYLYLMVPLFTSALRFGVSAAISKIRYHVHYHTKRRLSCKMRNELLKDVGSLSIYKLCRTLDATVDTMLISRFVSVAVTGIYGSVNMLFGALDELLGVFNDGMIASIGDLYAQGKSAALRRIFYQSFHMTYLLFGICAVTLVPFISDFVQFWIGHTLSDTCIYVIIINFVIYGFSMNVATFRNAIGIFRKGWLRPAFTAAFNLLFSIVLVIKIGLLGTLLGTTIARCLTLVWYDPYLVCRYGFDDKPYLYYWRYLAYLGFLVIGAILLFVLRANLPSMDTFFSVVWHGVLYLSSACMILLLLGMFFPEQKEIVKCLMGILRRNKVVVASDR